jgi:hypothetical protein
MQSGRRSRHEQLRCHDDSLDFIELVRNLAGGSCTSLIQVPSFQFPS